MPAIMIDGKNLDELSLRQIVEATANPARPFFAGGDRMDYTRNSNLLTLFGESSALDAEAVADRYHFGIATGAYSTRFNALRAGELLAWATVQGLLSREGDKWRLDVRERVFELCGPELKPRAVRVRGLEGFEAAAAEKIWQRELKRREKARVKRVGHIIIRTREMTEYIGTHKPGTKLGPDLERFAIAGVDTIIGCSELILGSMPEMSAKDADTISEAVRRIYVDVQHRVWEVADAERQRLRQIQRQEEIEAMAAIAAAFPSPPPPPPLPPYPADVRKWHVRGGYMGTNMYEVTGTREDVETTIRMIRERCDNGLSRPYFRKIEELGDGKFRAEGSMDLGTD